MSEIQKRATEAVRKFGVAVQKLAEAGRKATEAGQTFADQLQDWNFLPPSRLPELLTYTFVATDGAVCEASRLGFSPDATCWPAADN